MGGVAVANGSTLSATGEMQVSCNVPYVLSVDGVEWVPTASAGGVDSYLLSTGGVVRIFINGTRYFYFVNNVVPQFRHTSLQVLFTDGSQTISSVTKTDGSYFQGVVPDNATQIYIYLRNDQVTPSMTREDLLALGVTSVQGQISTGLPSYDSKLVGIIVTNFDASQYNAVFLGNVLLAFFEPAE